MGRFALSVIILLSVWAEASAQLRLTMPEAEPLGGTDTVSVLIAGDVMMHSRQLDYDFSDFFRQLSPLLESADFSAVNMEFSLGGEPYSGYPAFSAPDSVALCLARDFGVDVFLTANNHILDRGSNGLRRTLEVYSRLGRSFGTRYTGSSADSLDRQRNNPLMLFAKGVRIALVNFTYGTNRGKDSAWPEVNYMRRDDVAEALARARELGADFVVALPHWGTEYSLRHDVSQQEWAEWLVEHGADAVVGSHPHVVQDTTHIGGRPIIYSTGNLVSNMSARNTKLGLMVRLDFIHDFSSGEKRMAEPELIFTWCCLPGMLEDGYCTITVKERAGRRGDWLAPSDYDNMAATLERVCAATGINYSAEGL